MKLSKYKRHSWLLHCLYLLLIGLASVYILVSVTFKELNPLDWGRAAKVVAFVFSTPIVLPIFAIIITILIKENNKTENQND
jgi:hypothetical protein